jgi:hypothetical protein
MSPEQKKVAGDVCFFLREGEKDVDAIAAVAGCSAGTVYKYRRMLFPETARTYRKHRKPRKVTSKQTKIEFDTVMHDIANGIEKLAVEIDADTAKAVEAYQGHFGVDMVNHPTHYTAGGIETYDFIVAKGLSYELGNVVKYITRAKHKGNALQDLKKAQWYLNAAINREEQNNG